MRRYIKDQILDLFQTIVDGVEYARNADAYNALVIFEDCQNAICMIEKILNENTPSLKIKDAINELVKCKQVILVVKQLNKKDVKYNDQINQVINGLSKARLAVSEEKEKLEIVFLPYKASMWDSMESIWQAAVCDENCDTYVVPIPYYDRSANFTSETMHYEGDQFPSNVTITSYLKYDIASRNPDIIYIHNPYDDTNYVTSVAPRYYSKKLKEYTDMLVYVPYYVSRDILFRDEGISPAIVNSNKVIVQSKKVKQIILDNINRLTVSKTQEMRNELQKEMDNKLLPLGSPKFDKIINGHKEEIELPTEWKEMIGNKKIILYNVGVAGLLSGNEEVLRKIKDVFAYMERREDVVLWWRPHPLNKATCTSMRKELLDEYSKLELEYKNKKIGIYDDTSDVSRAINISDVYYGTPSSLVELFSITGKPVVYQNNFTLRNKEKFDRRISAYFYNGVLDDNNIWFVSGNFNGLFKYVIDKNEIIYMGKIPDEDSLSENLYKKVLKVGKSLWLIPCRAEELAEYNIETGEFTKYPLPNQVLTKGQKYVNAYLYKDKIVMVSTGECGILTFDIMTKKMNVYNSFVKSLKVIHPSLIFSDNGCLVRDRIYLITKYENKVIEFNLKTEKYTIHDLGINPDEFYGIRYDGKSFLIISSKSLINWDGKELIEYKLEGLEKEKSLFRDVVVYKKCMYLLVTGKNCIYKIKDKKIKQIKLFEDFDGNWVCFNMWQYENKVMMIFNKNRENTRLLILHLDGDHLEKRDLLLPSIVNKLELNESVFEKLRNANYNYSEWYPLWENNFINLDKIIEGLKSEEIISKDQIRAYKEMYANTDGKCGQKIHQKIIEEIVKRDDIR